MTVAMMLADNNMDIPDYCQHDPDLTDKHGNTVLMYLAQKGIIP